MMYFWMMYFEIEISCEANNCLSGDILSLKLNFFIFSTENNNYLLNQ